MEERYIINFRINWKITFINKKDVNCKGEVEVIVKDRREGVKAVIPIDNIQSGKNVVNVTLHYEKFDFVVYDDDEEDLEFLIEEYMRESGLDYVEVFVRCKDEEYPVKVIDFYLTGMDIIDYEIEE